MANLMNYLNNFIWAAIIFYLCSLFANAQELNDNSSSFLSENEINKIELEYYKKFAELDLKKDNLNQTKVSIINSKNSLILLNDFPLTKEDKIKIIDEIKIKFDEAKFLDTETLSQNINFLEDIKENLLNGNSEIANESIEGFFTNILNLENEIDNNLTSVKSEEIIQINNKIKDISTLITQNSNPDEIELINSIIDNTIIKKEKLNSRVLFVDDNLFSLIESEKNNLINKIELLIDIESNLSEPPEVIANKQIKQLEDEINQLNEDLNNKKLELQKSNEELLKNYQLLEELNIERRKLKKMIEDKKVSTKKSLKKAKSDPLPKKKSKLTKKNKSDPLHNKKSKPKPKPKSLSEPKAEPKAEPKVDIDEPQPEKSNCDLVKINSDIKRI